MFPLFSLLLSCSLVREAKGSLELSSLTHVQYRVPEWPIADLSTITQEWILTLILCRVAQIPFFFIGEYKYRYIRSSTRRVPILCDAICIHTKWMGANCTALYFEEECGTIPFQILFRFSTTPMWNQACHSDFEPEFTQERESPPAWLVPPAQALIRLWTYAAAPAYPMAFFYSSLQRFEPSIGPPPYPLPSPVLYQISDSGGSAKPLHRSGDLKSRGLLYFPDSAG